MKCCSYSNPIFHIDRTIPNPLPRAHLSRAKLIIWLDLFSTTEIDLLMIKSERFIWLRISVGGCTKFIDEWKVSDKETASCNPQTVRSRHWVVFV